MTTRAGMKRRVGYDNSFSRGAGERVFSPQQGGRFPRISGQRGNNAQVGQGLGQQTLVQAYYYAEDEEGGECVTFAAAAANVHIDGSALSLTDIISVTVLCGTGLFSPTPLVCSLGNGICCTLPGTSWTITASSPSVKPIAINGYITRGWRARPVHSTPLIAPIAPFTLNPGVPYLVTVPFWATQFRYNAADATTGQMPQGPISIFIKDSGGFVVMAFTVQTGELCPWIPLSQSARVIEVISAAAQQIYLEPMIALDFG